MSEIVYHVASSLDGFIADIDGGIDWLNEFDDPDIMEDFMEFFNSFECIALGGHTYDFALKHGQWMSPNTPSWVFTSRDLKIPILQFNSPPKFRKLYAKKWTIKKSSESGSWVVWQTRSFLFRCRSHQFY